MTRPLSIENRWDILYRDYPEVYDAFSKTPYHPSLYEELQKELDLRGRLVADVGSGNGSSSFALARSARRVIGVEIEPAMLAVAQAQPEAAAENVDFAAGDALALPLADASVDLVIGVTLALYPAEQYRGFILEGLRTARERVVYVGIPPGWYGGDLAGEIDEKDENSVEVERIFLDEFDFAYQDILLLQDYGSVEHMVATYGFIFGRRVIETIRREQRTTVRWKFRVYSRPIA